MISEIIKGYNDSKFAFIQKLSDSKEGIYDELDYLDDGYIKMKIQRLKNEYGDIQNQLNMLERYDKQDDQNSAKRKSLSIRISEIEFGIAFIASNNLQNIDSCIKLIENKNTDFELCIRGLQYYDQGNEKAAFDSFNSYFKNRNIVLEHYLINKIYGTISYNLNQYELSAILLRKAVEKRPDDIDIHRILKQIYLNTNKYDESQIESNILTLLEEGI